MIEVRNIYKKYGNNVILDIPYFNFKSGNSYMIIGSNGSGKSTLIKCLLGINKLNSGTVNINTANIGYVPEKFYFPDFCTVGKYLESIIDLYGKNDFSLINYYCNIFNLDRSKMLSKLSKGMMQKVLIIQAIIHDSDLFIFDEPLNGLDTKSQELFFSIVNNLKNKNKTIIITTHYPEFYSSNYDYIVKLDNKKLKYESNKII